MPYTPPSRSVASRFVLVATLLVFAGLGVLATLTAMGKIDWPFLRRVEAAEPKGPPPGTIPVPISRISIPAYTKVSRDHFLDPKTNQLTLVHLRPEQIRPGMLTLDDFSKLIGRVLAQDKPAGYAFLERELLPDGTRPGVGAGVPDDSRRGMAFDATKIQGVHQLKPGDRVDLIASLPPDTKTNRLPGRALIGVTGTIVDPNAKHALVRVVAQEAILLTGVTTRELPTTGRAQGPTKPIQEVTIAIQGHEITAVSEAQALNATLACVVHSNRPKKSEDKPVRLREPEEPKLTAVETIRGGKREVVYFPASGGAPVKDETVEK